MKYEVEVTMTYRMFIEVEADNRIEAETTAVDLFDPNEAELMDTHSYAVHPDSILNQPVPQGE